MDSADHIWTILLFAGLVQGLFVAAVLLGNRGADRRVSAVLAVLSLVLALMIGEELVDSANLYSTLPHAALIAFPLPLAIGPLIVLCARQLGDPNRALRARDLLHFVPMVAVVAYLAPFYGLDGTSKLIALDGEMRERIAPLVLFKGLHGLGYQIAAIILCARPPETAGPGGRARVVWFRRVLLAALVPVILVHVLYFYPSLGPVESDRAGSLVLAVMLYAFAYAAMRWPFFRSSAGDAPRPAVLGTPPVKYRTSSLDQERKYEIRDALLSYVKSNEPFRDPETSLGDIAQAIGVSTHDLSLVLNDVLKMNFHSFVNSHRIGLVKDMMANPDLDHRTLLELAFEAGFNSKTSFNRVFKETVGMTPSDYRRHRPGQVENSGPVSTAAVPDG